MFLGRLPSLTGPSACAILRTIRRTICLQRCPASYFFWFFPLKCVDRPIVIGVSWIIRFPSGLHENRAFNRTRNRTLVDGSLVARQCSVDRLACIPRLGQKRMDNSVRAISCAAVQMQQMEQMERSRVETPSNGVLIVPVPYTEIRS
jgi:hypothetical protein